MEAPTAITPFAVAGDAVNMMPLVPIFPLATTTKKKLVWVKNRLVYYIWMKKGMLQLKKNYVRLIFFYRLTMYTL